MGTEEVERLGSIPSRLLSRAALVASRLVSDALEAVDGQRHEFAVLVTLDELDAASQAELCRRCGIDRSDMAAIVASLEAAGHVTRTVDPDDRRRKLVQLTRAGRARLEELGRAVASAQDTLLEGWSAEEREHLVALLTPLARRA